MSHNNISRRRLMQARVVIPVERIERRIYVIRGVRVMLSTDLAQLYGVAAKRLNEAVRRNIERFPADFLFQLNQAEHDNLKSQIATSSWGGARRARPYAFSEQGIAMLSAVLNSSTAISVSIEIIRVFVRLRELLASHQHLRERLEELERNLLDHDQKFAVVFDAIRQIMNAENRSRKKPPIGYLSESAPRKKSWRT